MAFILYRHTRFRNRVYFLCIFLLACFYIALNCSFSSTRSPSKPTLHSEWSPMEGRKTQTKCWFPNEDGLAHLYSNITAFGLELAAGSLPNKRPGAASPPKRQILLVAYHRGGSTFLGEILNAYPGAFLHFEPLLMVTGTDQVRSRAEVAASLGILQNLLHCRFRNIISTQQYWARNCLWYIEFNLPDLAGCPVQARLCYSPAFFEAWCALHMIQIVKILRLRLDHAKQLLPRFPDLQIIHLVRDPRGMYNSRRKCWWCKSMRSCIDPNEFCNNIRKDLATAKALQEQFPNRIIEISYNELAIDTEHQVGRLLDFLKLPRSSDVEEFIRTHTRASKQDNKGNDVLTTYRDSKTRPSLWQKQLSSVDIARVEASCGDVIQHLGFNITRMK